MDDLLKYTLRIADNSLILGQRMAEWCSKGPTLEEDIAMSNIALDLFGQANGFLNYASTIHGKKTADDFVFNRNVNEFYNLQIVELENNDFGNTMIRNLLYDSFYLLFYQELIKSNDKMLSALAEKSLKEIKYHLRHSSSWVIQTLARDRRTPRWFRRICRLRCRWRRNRAQPRTVSAPTFEARESSWSFPSLPQPAAAAVAVAVVAAAAAEGRGAAASSGQPPPPPPPPPR